MNYPHPSPGLASDSPSQIVTGLEGSRGNCTGTGGEREKLHRNWRGGGLHWD